jgi:predicted NAD-dependent protein-ADP-ribosyltransferase YbiA (DUF1768 family)
MSEFLVTKVHIDALMTAALHWSEAYVGPEQYRRFRYLDPVPADPCRISMKALTPETADEVGRTVWRHNFNRSEWGYEEEFHDEEDGPGLPTVMSYVFEELPGQPDPVLILQAITCYDYQTSGEGGEPDAVETLAVDFIAWLQGQAIIRLPGSDFGLEVWPIDSREIFLPYSERSQSPAAEMWFDSAVRNEYPAEIEFGSVRYPSVVHAFWALSTSDEETRARIRAAAGPREVKELVAGTPQVDNWGQISVAVLAGLLRAKFTQHPNLAETLISTGSSLLPPTAGQSPDRWIMGEDSPGWTGRLLELIRAELVAERAGLSI